MITDVNAEVERILINLKKGENTHDNCLSQLLQNEYHINRLPWYGSILC